MKLIRRFLFVPPALVLLWIGASFWAGNQVAHPPRRPLHDYHLEYLASPASHGTRVSPFTTSATRTPCLLVEPLADGILGSRGETIRRQLSERGITLAPSGKIIGTLVLLHGRRGRKEDYLLIAERFAACGFRCVIPDLPGHGTHPDPLATYGLREHSIAEEMLDEAEQRYGFRATHAGLMGISMGGAVAIQTASRHPERWSALAVLSTFDTLENVVSFQAQRLVGPWLAQIWVPGAAWTYRSKSGMSLSSIRSIDAAASLSIPTLIGHGTADTIIPFELGQRLHASLPSSLPQEWVEIPDADHDNVLITDFPIYATLATWFLNHLE